MTGPLVLTLNAGSSSLKFALYEVNGDPVQRAMGIVEKIGGAPRLKATFGVTTPAVTRNLAVGEAVDHAGALATALELLRKHFPIGEAAAVGHRVVHGGTAFSEPAIVRSEVLDALRALSPFAPLHQPHNIAGIEAAMTAFPDALQVACFDTAFHRGHPKVSDIFALPREYYDKGVRRYGFHGLSYAYIAGELARIAPEIHRGRVVVAHLGNGASMCGMIGGRSIASSMGFTALDGLPMGTRTGQIDPGVIFYLVEQEGMSIAEVSRLFYSGSGLLGLSGLSNDMRTLEAAGTSEAEEAIAYFVSRARRELAGLAADLGGLDALVFTAGIGEHSAPVRQRVCAGLGVFGIVLDEGRNARSETVISVDGAPTAVLVVPTDEERAIAEQTARLVTRRLGGEPSG